MSVLNVKYLDHKPALLKYFLKLITYSLDRKWRHMVKITCLMKIFSYALKYKINILKHSYVTSLTKMSPCKFHFVILWAD